MFLVFFGAINRGGTVQLGLHGPEVGYTTFFAPGMRKLLAWLAVGLVVSLRTFRWERAA
jgi:hypothetical protein